MDCEIVKGKPLTKDETKFLLELIENSKIITTKTTNATNNKLKNEEWIRLADRFNASARNCPRTVQQLRLKWENLKKTSRKRSTKIRMNQIKTGGGPPEYVPPDEILDRVTRLLDNTVSGFTVPFGGDKQPVGLDDGENSGDGIGDARVSVDNVKNVVMEYDKNTTPSKTKRLTFSTPRAVKKTLKPDESRTARNIAIAEYFTAKKKYIYAKLNNIHLENEKLILEKEKLKLELEKLKQL